jgi:hypothetical protein
MECPEEVSVGQTIKVMGNSTFPAGTSFDLVLYQTQYTSTEIERRTVTLQDYNNKTFVVPFSTRGLKGGMYKVEVQFDSEQGSKLSSDSVVLKMVNVLDRSGEITITSPFTQELADALRIEGSIAKLGDAGVKIDVRGPEGPVFGPTWIETRRELKQGAGEFTKKVTVSLAGDYDVQFTDTEGYIGVVTFHVSAPAPTGTVQTLPSTRATTRMPATTAPTTAPVPTKSPAPAATFLLALLVTGSVAIAVRGKIRR